MKGSQGGKGARTPPAIYDIEAEKAVIATAMMAPELTDRIVATLSADDFASARHREIFAAIEELAEEGRPADQITVRNRIAATTDADPADLAQRLVDIGGLCCDWAWESHARIVRELSIQRRVWKAARVIEAISSRPRSDFGEYLAEVRSAMEKALEGSGSDRAPVEPRGRG